MPTADVIAYVRSSLPGAPARVLEVGAGDGSLAAALRRRELGVLTLNSPGDLVVLEAGHEADLLAHLGAPAVRTTIVGGVPVSGSRTIH